SARWIARPSETPLPVDVVYLYPTAWHKIDAGESNLCAIDNKTLLEGGEQAFAMQATAFETAGNVFAPYYRQGDASFVLGLPIEQQTKLLNGTPKQDIYAALDYYFEYLNEGRPFILAGHSQGSNMLLFVLSEYLQMHPELQDRMVAAYAIGYSITDSFLSENKHLSFAEKADDTGVIVSYNTEAPTVEGKNPVVIDGALAINPLTWTRSTETASASLSKGARMNGVDLGPIADASVDLERGTVICSSVNPDDYISATGLFPRGVYHGQDYGFYYYDLRANAEQRAQAYLESHS
ncbi:MAG: DUF3089 domain-containing protein, partial [Raoultibacter sp.]